MSNQKLRAIYKQLNEKIEDAREAALFEVKDLKTDLNELQRHLSGRKKSTDIQPDDILRSAYEISHKLREIQKRRDILAEMEGVAAEAEAEEYLNSRGAKMLSRPIGWHFQTSKERFLLHESDAVEAAAELRKLLKAGKRLKRPSKAKKPKPKAVAPVKKVKESVEAAPIKEEKVKAPKKAAAKKDTSPKAKAPAKVKKKQKAEEKPPAAKKAKPKAAAKPSKEDTKVKAAKKKPSAKAEKAKPAKPAKAKATPKKKAADNDTSAKATKGKAASKASKAKAPAQAKKPKATKKSTKAAKPKKKK